MDELVAPDYDGFDNAGVVLVSLDSIITLRGIYVAPENIEDFVGTRTWGGVG